MAERTVIDIDVNSDEFKRFAEAFDKYQKALKSTLDDWKKINQEMGKGRPGGGGGGTGGGATGGGTGFFGFDLRIFERVRNEVEKITHGFRDIERMAKPGGSLYGLIGLMPGGAPGLQLLSKMGMGGPIGAGLAVLAAGFSSAIMAAPGAADERRRTLGMGVGVTEARAFAAGMGRNILGDPNAALQALASAQYSITSRERGAMNMLFGAPGARAELGKDRTTAMFDILEAMRKRLETYKPELRQSMARSLGFENLVPYGDIQAWMALPEKGKGSREEAKSAALAAAKDAKEQADQVKEATDNLTKLNASLQRAETAVSNMATDIEGKFAPALTRFIDATTDQITKLTKAGLPSIHTGPMTMEDIQRNLTLGYDRYGATINPDGSSANFPEPGAAVAASKNPNAPTSKRKQNRFSQWLNDFFGTGDSAPVPGAPPAGPGNAAWTPGPTAFAIGGGADSEWMKKWFMQESAATKAAADAAQKRDQQITNLLDYLIGHKGGTAAAAGAADGVKAALGSVGGGGLTFGNATGSIMPKGGGMFPQTGSLFGGAGATVASGNLKKNQDEAYAAAKAAGLSDTAARALVANFSGESLRDPSNTTGDKGQAQGIGQWHRDRANAIFQHFGKYPAQMSVAEQTKAAIWEMQTNPAYKQSWAALQGGGSAENMVSTLVSNYERPGDVATATAQRMRFLHGLAPGAVDTKAGDVISSRLTSEQKAFFAARGATPDQIAGVRPEFASKLIAGISASEKAVGEKAHFESLFRSYAKQKDIYEHPGKYGATVVAKPGTSPHEFGVAADIGRDRVSEYLTKHISEYGLETVRGDPGHFQMPNARRYREEPMAMNQWQQPDRRNRLTVNSNFGADIAVQAATLVS